jgi:BMFP domain-containing protein YqiC
MATAISDKVRDGLTNAKQQFGELHDKAINSFTDVRGQVGEVPEQLRGAWDRVVHRIFGALDVPSREDFDRINQRLDGLERKIDRLGRKDRTSAPKRRAGRR